MRKRVIILCLFILIIFAWLLRVSNDFKKVEITYQNGGKLIVWTKAKQLKNALEKAGIKVKANDLVNPPLTSRLAKDNYVFILPAKKVFMWVDGKILARTTYKNTPKEVLKECGIRLNSYDIIYPTPSKLLSGNRTNFIYFRKARVVYLRDGETKLKKCFTTARSVGEFLKEKNVALHPKDRVMPKLSASIYSGCKIRIVRIRRAFITKRVLIPYKVVSKRDPSLYIGTRRVAQYGEDGVKEIVILVYYRNNKMTQKSIFSERIIRPPKDEIVVVGTRLPNYAKQYRLASRGQFSGCPVLIVEATAYYPGVASCGRYANGYTATGMKAGYGVVAVDPALIPMGTHLYVEGYGYAIAADRGSVIKGYRIDLCFNTYYEAISYGRRWVKVYILGK